ncbi:MAG: cysteine hydrolase [Sphingomonadaceae bacterium]|nr:cysteine hydrolase [Sphingomonadaceae bacterium]
MTVKGLGEGQRAALVISECQNGITNIGYSFSPLAEQVAARGIIAKIAELAASFRAASLPVVHCLITMPEDPSGWTINCVLAARLAKEGKLVTGTRFAAVHDDLPVQPCDIVSERHHGMSPFTGTMLDATLRRHRIDTVVLAGVSTNVALPGASTEAVGLGYSVVIAEDCTSGGTADTHQVQISMHLPLIATVSDSASIRAAIAAQTEAE